MSRSFRPLPLLFAFLVLAARPASAQAAAPPGSASSAVTVSPGDVLKVTVWGHQDMSGEFVVGPDGALIHPLYREFPVAGLPLPAMEERFRTYLQRWDTNPRFVLEPLLRVTVGGAVASPGFTNVPPGTSIAQAVMLAGGVPGDADRARIVFERRGVRQALDLRSDAARAPVQSGDEISVSVRSAGSFTRYVSSISSIVSALVGIVMLATR
jgi:polysaccharide export outer membrane protein